MVLAVGSGDPWAIAYECSRGRIGVGEVVAAVAEALSRHPYGSREYLWGVELAKALLSVSRDFPHVLPELARSLRPLAGRIAVDAVPQRVYREYRVNPALSMGLLALWEILAEIGMHDTVAEYVKKLIELSWGEITGDYGRVRDLVKPAVQGPLLSLPPRYVASFADMLAAMEPAGSAIAFKIEALYSIATLYPPSDIACRELVEALARLTRSIAIGVLERTRTSDPEEAVSLSRDLMLAICGIEKALIRDTSQERLYRVFTSIAGGALDELYGAIGGLVAASLMAQGESM